MLAMFLAASVVALGGMTDDQRYIAAPGLACVITVLALWMILWDRDQAIPLFDVGMLCALATVVYSVYPLINYWADGMQFGELADARLAQYDLEPKELGLFHLRHVLYLVSFAVFYSIFRGKAAVTLSSVSFGSNQRNTIILFCVLISVYFFLLAIATGVTFSGTYESDTRMENLDLILSLPLPVLQVSLKLAGVLALFKIAFLLVVLRRWPHRGWRFFFAFWIVTEIIQAIVIRGSRTSVILFLMSAALVYHRTVRRLSMMFIVSCGLALFSFFIFMGIYRYNPDLTTLSELSQGILAMGNEFQSLLGTAYDVYQRKISGARLPWYLYINDIISVLPPQQIMPFEKVPASEWYLREIGMSNSGVGFMWGVISQCIVGLDWFECFLRGAGLAYVLAWVHRWYVRHQSGLVETTVYVYLCTISYYTFRDTTGSILTAIVWGVVPFYIALRFTSSSRAMFGKARLNTHESGQRSNGLPLAPEK